MPKLKVDGVAVKKKTTYKHGVKARRRRYLKKKNNWKLHSLDIHERRLCTKFECHSISGMAIITRKHSYIDA